MFPCHPSGLPPGAVPQSARVAGLQADYYPYLASETFVIDEGVSKAPLLSKGLHGLDIMSDPWPSR